jgi:hypothetical protein
MVWTGDGHNGEGNGTMTNKYASNCTTCQTRVVAGAGILSKVAAGWNVSCGKHTATASTVKVVIVNTEAVASAMQELAEARTECAVWEVAQARTFPIVMAMHGSKEKGAFEAAQLAHNANTSKFLAARKRAGRAASTLENLRAGR